MEETGARGDNGGEENEGGGSKEEVRARGRKGGEVGRKEVIGVVWSRKGIIREKD